MGDQMKRAFGALVVAAALMAATSENVLSKGGGSKPGGGGGGKAGGGKKGGNWDGGNWGGGYYRGYNGGGGGDADESASEPELVKLDRRYLAVSNQTGEPITVFLQYYTLTSKGGWQWFPAQPSNKDGKSVLYKLEPERTVKLLHDDWAISASKIRIWALTKSGVQMNEFRNQDLALVPEPGQVYYAVDTGTYTFTFERPQLAEQSQEKAESSQTAEERRWLKELMTKATTPQQRKDLEQAWRSATTQERREFYLKNGGTLSGSAKGDR
jgi:hypothetical protein